MADAETQPEIVLNSESFVEQVPEHSQEVQEEQTVVEETQSSEATSASTTPLETEEPEAAPAPTSNNPMKQIKIAKVTLNIGAGKSEDMMNRGIKLLQKLSPLNPVKTTTSKRIPGWGLRPGLAIGCKVTIRKNPEALLKRLLAAKENILLEKNFDDNGNFSFGVPEYIDIEGLEYDPELKIMGLEVAVTLERPGYRIKRRKIRSTKIGGHHGVTKQDAMNYAKQALGVEVQAK
jgi:large subunit ribosomal protein L5